MACAWHCKTLNDSVGIHGGADRLLNASLVEQAVFRYAPEPSNTCWVMCASGAFVVTFARSDLMYGFLDPLVGCHFSDKVRRDVFDGVEQRNVGSEHDLAFIELLAWKE